MDRGLLIKELKMKDCVNNVSSESYTTDLLSVQQLAAKFNVSVSTVQRFLKENNVEPINYLENTQGSKTPMYDSQQLETLWQSSRGADKSVISLQKIANYEGCDNELLSIKQISEKLHVSVSTSYNVLAEYEELEPEDFVINPKGSKTPLYNVKQFIHYYNLSKLPTEEAKETYKVGAVVQELPVYVKSVLHDMKLDNDAAVQQKLLADPLVFKVVKKLSNRIEGIHSQWRDSCVKTIELQDKIYDIQSRNDFDRVAAKEGKQYMKLNVVLEGKLFDAQEKVRLLKMEIQSLKERLSDG